jgi:hypothetical protein
MGGSAKGGDAVISTKDKSVLQLITRSPDGGDGWRVVSKVCWPLIEQFGEPKLIEIDKQNMRVRLTESGRTVVEFAL